jgi:hypothetical protein
MHRRWCGQPQINTRLPKEQFRAVLAEARRRGIPASFVIKELVQQWYRHGFGTPSDAQVDAPSSPLPQSLRQAAQSAPSGMPHSFAEMLAENAQHARTRAPSCTSQHRDYGATAIPKRLVRSRSVDSATLADAVAPGKRMFHD